MTTVMAGDASEAENLGEPRAADGRLVRVDDLPIPHDASVGIGWSPLMVEIADHIGVYATLKLLERFGGENFRISRASRRDRFAEVIGEAAARAFQEAFHGEKLDLPIGRDAIWRAKAKPIVDRVREGSINIADAARILRVGRTRIHALLDEQPSPRVRRRRTIASKIRPGEASNEQ